MRNIREIVADKRLVIERKIGPTPSARGFAGTVKLRGENGAHLYHVMFTLEFKDGKPIQEHASVSRKAGTKLPGWLEMQELKEILWRDDEECIQIHPKKSDYVNIMGSCLHIWHPILEPKGAAEK